MPSSRLRQLWRPPIRTSTSQCAHGGTSTTGVRGQSKGFEEHLCNRRACLTTSRLRPLETTWYILRSCILRIRMAEISHSPVLELLCFCCTHGLASPGGVPNHGYMWLGAYQPWLFKTTGCYRLVLKLAVVGRGRRFGLVTSQPWVLAPPSPALPHRPLLGFCSANFCKMFKSSKLKLWTSLISDKN